MNPSSSFARIGFLGIDLPVVDTLFVVAGTFMGVGEFATAAGLLGGGIAGGSLEGALLTEAMKAFVAGGVMTAQRYSACKATGSQTCKPTPPGFIEAWQAQAAYRVQKAAEVYTVGVAGAILSSAAGLLTPTIQAEMSQAWDLKRKSEAYARDPDHEARGYLNELQRACEAKAGSVCRKDTIAQAVNLANGATIFDTTDWDLLTGEPPPEPTTNLTAKRARELYYEAVRAAGTSDAPGPAAALAVVRAAERQDARIAAIAVAKAKREADAAAALADLDWARRKNMADAMADPFLTRTTSPTPPAPKTKKTLFTSELFSKKPAHGPITELAILAALTAPAWGTILWLKHKRGFAPLG